MTSLPLHSIGVEKLRGVGPLLSAKLQKLGLYTVQDLLFHLPLRYIDRTKITAIGGVQPLTEVVIEGEVRGSDVVFGRRRSLVCRVQDHSGLMTLRFFHFNQAQQQSLAAGHQAALLWRSTPREIRAGDVSSRVSAAQSGAATGLGRNPNTDLSGHRGRYPTAYSRSLWSGLKTTGTAQY